MRAADRVRWGLLASLVAVSVTVIDAPAPATAQEAAPPLPPAVTVRITDAALDPATVVAVPGQTIVFENTTAADAEVEAADASFDSGPIAPGGAFVAAIDATGTIDYATAGDPARTGRIVFGIAGLPGAAGANARQAIPDIAPPPTELADFGPHPDYGYPTSRTRILVQPTATATVAEVNAALSAVGATIVAGFGMLDAFGVAVPDTGDHSGVLAAIDALRAHPAFAFTESADGVVDPSSGAVAPVWLGDTEIVPDPFVPTPDLLPYIFGSPTSQPTRGDWGLQRIRAPAAWNALDLGRARRTAGHAVDTVVLDGGFDPAHPDVPFQSVVSTDVRFHGTHVAGTIGATFDNAVPGGSRGTAGVNPLATLHGVSYIIDERPGQLAPAGSVWDFAASFTTVIGEKRFGGRYPRLGVINASFGLAAFTSDSVTEWADAVRTRTCGPGPDDDVVPGGSLPCTPLNEDNFIADLAQVSKGYAGSVLGAARSAGVAIVKSAGNARDDFCTASPSAPVLPNAVFACYDPPPGVEPRTQVTLDAVHTNEFVVALRQLGAAASTYPVLVVGAEQSNGFQAVFSQAGGDLIAPGVGVRSATIPDDPDTDMDDRGDLPLQGPSGEWYGESNGTSMAAPHVTGAVGYLMALVPSLTALQAVQLVKQSAAVSLSPGNRNHLDLFDLVVRSIGVSGLADANDHSPDGNRRVARTASGAVAVDVAGTTTPDGRAELGFQRSQPDGVVDLRDARAFRDAWLQTCVDGSATDAGSSASVSCPAPDQIDLDGPDSHSKLDTNGDGCVRSASRSCPIGEAAFNRFDLNGDGRLAVNTSAPMFVDASTGATSDSASQLSDLDVLELALAAGRSEFDGWGRASVGTSDFLQSADVTIELPSVPSGTTGLRVSLRSDVYAIDAPVTVAPDGTVTPSVLSVPVDDDGSKIRLWYTATRGGQAVASATATTPVLRYGGDATVALCEARLAVTAPTVLAFGQSVLASARVESCGTGTTPPNVGDLTFTVEPVDPATSASPPVLGAQPVTPDPGGVARTPLTAGTAAGWYRLRATATTDGGVAIRGEELVRVVPRIEVRYRWEAEVTGVATTTSTDWPDVVPGRPDCREIPATGCVVTATTGLAPGEPTPTVTRDGTLVLDANGVRLDETVGGTAGAVTVEYSWEDLAGGATTTGTQRLEFEPVAGQSVDDRPVPVQVRLDADGAVVVDGFRFVGDVAYRSSVTEGGITGNAPDPGVFGVPGELVPLSVATPASIQHSGDPADVTRLRPAAGGGFTPVTWCGNVTTRLDRQPGYFLPTLDPNLDGIALRSDPVYDAGDVPMPAGAGSYRREIRVAFTAHVGAGAAPAPVLPACTGSSPPVSAFTVDTGPDGQIDEGERVQFLDASTDPDGDISSWAWAFDDLRSSRARDPLMVPGFDGGTRTASLRVTDTGARSNRSVQTFAVEERPPTIEAVEPIVTTTPDVPAVVRVIVDDPGPTDRRRLLVRVERGGSWISSVERHPAGLVTLPLEPLPLGVHRVSAIVRDDAFNEVSVPITVIVAPEQPPPPPPRRDPLLAASCAAPTPQSAGEAELLDRWNRARATAGLPPLELSPELSAAAGDIARASLGGLGIAASVDPVSVAADAGYAGSATVRALAASRDEPPAVVLELLRASEVGTIFSTTAQMAGVALVADGPDAKWVVVTGDVVDCDAAPEPTGVAPTVDVVRPTAPVPEGATVGITVDAQDADDDLAEVRVEWGDGTTGTTVHRYRDDGTYQLLVRAVDEQGNVTTAGPFDIVVTPAAPEVAITVSPLADGVAAAVDVAATDPAEADRPLELVIETVPAGVLDVTTTIQGGATFVVTPPAGVGTLELVATVTDDDGLSTSATTGPVTVTAPPAASPTPPPSVDLVAPDPPCATAEPVGLRGQAADYVARSNAFRAAQGAAPLIVVPELQEAAERHLANMVNNRFFAHVDQAGRSPLDRARLAGYSGGVGENIAMRFVTAEQVLLGFRSSPVHLENLLDPVWNATAVAVANGPDGVVWIQLFGTTVTCPTTARTAPAPIALANPALERTSPVAASSTGRSTSATPRHAAPGLPERAAPAQEAPPTDADVAAYTVDRLAPAAGDTVTVTNRSRVDGQPVAATLAFGDLSPRLLAVDGSFTRAIYRTQRIAVDIGTATAALDVDAAGTYDPAVTVLSPAPNTSVVQGAPVPISVRVTDPGGGVLVGVVVRAAPVGGAPAEGVTDASGQAVVEVRMPTAGAGVVELVALRADGTDGPVTPLALVVTSNTPPIADAGGPYALELGRPLLLDAPMASDADGDGIVSYQWDVDGDGEFDDATGRTATVPWAAVVSGICGGVCDVSETGSVRLRVTDGRGASADSTASVTIVRDYALLVTPQTLTVPPGSSVNLRVDVLTTSGFDRPVSLSLGALPAGVTATLSSPTAWVGSPVYLSVTVASNVPSTTTNVPISITGSATLGDGTTLVRTVAPEVSVLFGLQRSCTVTWSGRLVDATTGAAVQGFVTVGTLPTVAAGPDGSWTVTGVPLGSQNEPRLHGISFGAQGAHLGGTTETAVCDVDRDDIVLRIHRIRVVDVRVRVTDAATPVGRPAGAQVSLGNFAWSTSLTRNPDADGYVEFQTPLAGPDNRATVIRVTAGAPGYHGRTLDRSISIADTAAVVPIDLPLVRACSATFTGGTVVDPDGRPVAGARVAYGATWFDPGVVAFTGPDGRFTLGASVPLAAPNNDEVVITPVATPPADRTDLVGSGTSVRVTGCRPFEATLRLAFNPNGAPRYGDVVVRVTDPDGAPIAGAKVSVDGPDRVTPANGEVRFDDVQVGSLNPETGAEPNPRPVYAYVTAGRVDAYSQPLDWWDSSRSGMLGVGEELVLTVVLDPVRFVDASGIVVDAQTGAPMPGQLVRVWSPYGYGPMRSDDAGRFALGPTRLNRTGPTDISVGTDDTTTHWGAGAFVRVPEGTTDPVQLEVRMLPKCAPATVVGRVVAEDTGEPIAGATVGGEFVGWPTTTAADGSFQLTFPIDSRDNAAYRIRIAASAPSFNRATRDVTIFCGARLVVDFDRPPPGFGTVTGVVTDPSGAPAGDVFVGSSWGAATRTAADGSYSLGGAPANGDGSARSWTVTAVPDPTGPWQAAAATVSVAADETVTADLALTERPVGPPANRAPVAAVAPASPSTPEGTPIELSATGSSDPDGDALTFAWDVDGDGFDDGAQSTLSFRPTRAGNREVRVRATDPGGLSSTAAVTVVATNVAPSVVAGGDVTIGPDGAFARPVQRFDDPGDGDDFTATVDWGEGAGPQPLDRIGRSFDLRHQFAAPGAYRVVVRVCDAAGGCGDGAFTVTVSTTPLPNLPPVASVRGPAEALTGATVTFDASASTDPEAQPLSFAWDVDGDGALDDGTGPTVSFVAAAPGTRSVVVQVTDPQGASSAATAVLVVTDPSQPVPVPLPTPSVPAIESLADVGVTVGERVSVVARFRDAVAAPAYTATIDWGDGAGPRPVTVAGSVGTQAAGFEVTAFGATAFEATAFDGTVALGTTYDTAGTYRATVTVCGAQCASASFSVVVTAGAGAVPQPTPMLPATGADVAGPVRIAQLLVLVGLALLLLGHRRRTHG